MRQMKKEFNDSDFITVMGKLTQYFVNKTFIDHKGKAVFVKDMSETLGLPYTSSSDLAMISLDCNVHLYHPYESDYHYSHCGINDVGEVVLFLWNNAEQEMAITL